MTQEYTLVAFDHGPMILDPYTRYQNSPSTSLAPIDLGRKARWQRKTDLLSATPDWKAERDGLINDYSALDPEIGVTGKIKICSS